MLGAAQPSEHELHFRERAPTVVRNAEEVGVDVPVKAHGQGLKMSVDDVTHMISRAHIKAHAVENAGGRRAFYESITFRDSVVTSLAVARLEYKFYYDRISNGLSDIASGKKGEWGYAGGLHEELQGISANSFLSSIKVVFPPSSPPRFPPVGPNLHVVLA